VLAALAMAASGYVGVEVCKGCHTGHVDRQSRTHHARALRRVDGSQLEELFGNRALRERSGIEFSYRGKQVTVTQGDQRVEAAIEWVFGSGAQAITPVGRHEGKYFEHRISWYRQPGQGARTIGHSSSASRNVIEALGRAQDAGTMFRCFNCHATGVRPGPDLSGTTTGIQCERCHGPGSDHARQPSRANIKAFTKLGAQESVGVCAECHRSPNAVVASGMPERDDPFSVRFQPVGLMASACFKKSGKLSCVTCHDPHEDAANGSQHYTTQCVRCHSAGGKPVKNCKRREGADCLGCHMQKSFPHPFLTFTDHRIRVY